MSDNNQKVFRLCFYQNTCRVHYRDYTAVDAAKRFKAPFKLNLTVDLAKILFFVEVLVYITSQGRYILHLFTV